VSSYLYCPAQLLHCGDVLTDPTNHIKKYVKLSAWDFTQHYFIVHSVSQSGRSITIELKQMCDEDEDYIALHKVPFTFDQVAYLYRRS